MARAMARTLLHATAQLRRHAISHTLEADSLSFIVAIKRIASGGKSVNSSKGSAMFSSSVMEPKSAPL